MGTEHLSMKREDFDHLPPILAIGALVFLSLVVAIALFTGLGSTASAEYNHYKLTGAAAGFAVTLGTLIVFYKWLSSSQRRIEDILNKSKTELDQITKAMIEISGASVAEAQPKELDLDYALTARIETLRYIMKNYDQNRLSSLEKDVRDSAVYFVNRKYQGISWTPQLKDAAE
jgi:hypothetical protein